jgi:hypothetical protein
MIRTRLIICVILGVLVANGAAAAISVNAVGSWSRTVAASDLVAGAGSDLHSSYESAAAQVSLHISGATDKDDAWRVDVSKTNGTWSGAFHLFVRRTGNGDGAGSISGGATYQEIGSMATAFFSGAGDRTSIPLQLELSGMSVQASPNTYSTTVTYTVVDTL